MAQIVGTLTLIKIKILFSSNYVSEFTIRIFDFMVLNVDKFNTQVGFFGVFAF